MLVITVIALIVAIASAETSLVIAGESTTIETKEGKMTYAIKERALTKSIININFL